MLLNAAPEELQVHKNVLSEVFQHLQGQGVDTAALASQAGASTNDPQQMSHTDLLSTTLALARAHPEVVQMVAQRFPEAQGLLGMVLGSSASSNTGGGLLGNILGRL